MPGALQKRSDFALSPQEKSDARKAIVLLHGSGLTLELAVRIALAGKRAVRRINLSDAVEEFMGSRRAKGARQSTQGWYDDMLRGLRESHGDRNLDEITRSDIDQWLAGMKVSHITRSGHARAVRALWRWGARAQPPIVGSDITDGLQTTFRSDAEIRFLSVDECQKIIDGSGRHRNAITLMLFAGVRPEEVAGKHKARMTWASVLKDEKLIRISSALSKTGRPRTIEGLPDTIWNLITPGNADEAISQGRAQEVTKFAASLAGYGKDRRWPQDGLRHTFATYHVAAFSDPGKTALMMGHEGNQSMLYRHYRGLTTKADAEKFWAIRPALGV